MRLRMSKKSCKFAADFVNNKKIIYNGKEKTRVRKTRRTVTGSK